MITHAALSAEFSIYFPVLRFVGFQIVRIAYPRGF